jgi:hypothetical protein
LPPSPVPLRELEKSYTQILAKGPECIRMKRAEEYRKKAEEADTMAAATRDPGAKKAYLEIAQQWRQLAEHAENMER